MARRAKPADQWSGIDPENRPTPERQAHGVIRPVEFSEKGEGRAKGKVAFDFEATPIMRAFHRGKITERQKDAAARYLWLYAVTKETGGRRDSLDMTPRGSNEWSESRLNWMIDRKQEISMAEAATPPAAMMVVKSVVVHEEPIGDARAKYRRYALLMEGLDALADVWKMPGEKFMVDKFGRGR